MPVWAYVLMLVFVFSIGLELTFVNDNLKFILKELQKPKEPHRKE